MLRVVKPWASFSTAFRKADSCLPQICGSNILIAREKPAIQVYPFGRRLTLLQQRPSLSRSVSEAEEENAGPRQIPISAERETMRFYLDSTAEVVSFIHSYIYGYARTNTVF